MNAPCILALDASSTMIGYVLLDGGTVADHGEIRLTGPDIAERCRQAHAALNLLLANHPQVDALAIESPVARFASAVIPQARVSGALLAVAALRGLHAVEIPPTTAKQRLAGSGAASKADMQAAADGWGVCGEHATDALGVALAAQDRVEVVAQ